jgi:osmoprotectant transport system permease protein
VSVGTIIGVQQLGMLFSDGFNRDFYDPLIVGIIGCVVLALLFDGIIIVLARLLTPWIRATGSRA